MSVRPLRHAHRDLAWRQCLVRIDPTTIIRGLLTDTSETGAQLRCKYLLQADALIDVYSTDETSRRRARVVRHDGNSFGLEWT